MFERARVFHTLVLVLSASSLGAQQDLASLRARQAELSARAESLRVAVKDLRAAEEDSGIVANVRAGSLGMRTTTALEARASDGLAQSQKAAFAALGPDAEALEHRVTLTLRENRSSVLQGGFLLFAPQGMRATKERMTSATLSASLDGNDLTGVTLYPPVTKEDVSESVLMVLEQAAAYALPDTLKIWAGNRIPLREPAPDVWPEIYRALATADAAVVRRCVAGERSACRLAFAIDSIPANPVATWYDDSDLPGLARRAGDHIQRAALSYSVSTDEREECVERNNTEVCRRILAYLPRSAFPIPLSFMERAMLVRFALQTGGAHALARLGQAKGTLAEQLALTAGVPADSLIALWQRRVIAARPASPLPSTVFVLASFACIATCVMLAAWGRPWK